MTHTNTLTGQVAVVTGSTQGLGEAVARHLADLGLSGLVLCGRSQDKGEALADSLTGGGCRAVFVTADLGNIDDCRRIMRTADDTFGRVDILVNCAGNTERGTLLDTDEATYDRLFNVNTKGPFFLMQDAAKIMIREGIEGRIVNVLSMSGHGGQPFISPYSGSKGALATLTRNAAFSLMRNRIRVNGLNIGWMNTPGEDRIQKDFHGASEGWLDEAVASQPMGRLLEPGEVARGVAFLATETSGMMTGSIIDFDQSVLGCYEAPPQPASAMTLPDPS
ncbi:SDR family oxidoreductase [Aidingimonas halophila]|uniref:NAD(P)-dependent dehydrogenase, short-chain alcohol dehydrogenase family n=1 Tax=Aidingimonas halophila TaxID=574349 RepID=A0A1H2ZDR4_9GAMM|nr:SDR family oxidoreductase [Aidingimonas halophila]GHC15832.1 short-chain dehydrogenase [Aidingimonas halophila]SDX15521.1 NAD(P)-dependent dehydrogenase, short-chain alcohol dehydrogenase family [Aidingimonas halophila]